MIKIPTSGTITRYHRGYRINMWNEASKARRKPLYTATAKTGAGALQLALEYIERVDLGGGTYEIELTSPRGRLPIYFAVKPARLADVTEGTPVYVLPR